MYFGELATHSVDYQHGHESGSVRAMQYLERQIIGKFAETKGIGKNKRQVIEVDVRDFEYFCDVVYRNWEFYCNTFGMGKEEDEEED